MDGTSHGWLENRTLSLGSKKRDSNSLVAREASNASFNGDDFNFVASMDNYKKELCRD